MKLCRQLIMLLLGVAALSEVHAVDISAWTKRMSITFPGYTNAETLTSFPVEVRLNAASIPGFNYSHFSSTNGFDLRFTDGSTNAFLNYEFEKWNTGGSSYVWVKMPNLIAGTNILAFWGNPAATTQQAYTTNGAAWSGTFVGVWHLNEGTGPFRDSTANGNHSIGDANSLQITGISGLKNGRHFDGGQNIPSPTNGYIDFANSPSMQSLWSGSTGGTNLADYSSTGGLFMTVEFWSRIPSTPEEYQRIISCYSTDGWGIQTLGGRFRFEQNGMAATGTTYIMDNAWHYCSHTYDGNTGRGKLYTDGNLDADYTTSYVHGYPYGFAIGAGGPPNAYQPNGTGHGNPFNGEVDEVRITRGVRSPTWVKTTYLTVQSNTTFQSYGTVQDLVPGESQVLINNGDSWKYFSTGALPTSSWYSAAYSDTAWSNGAAPLGYNDPALSTTIPYGSDINNKWITYYFRKHFTVSNAVAVTGLVAQFEVDDGAVFYLNGTKIHTTSNMIEPINNTSLTTNTSIEPYEWTQFTISPSLLVTGDNVMSVEVHQAATNSSDLYMDMILTKVGYATTNELGGGVTFTPPDYTDTSPSWTAYNDLSWDSSQISSKISRLTWVDDADHDLSGKLLRYADGVTSPVTATFAGAAGAGLWVTTNQGSPNAGTPGYVLFDGKLDMDRTVFVPSTSTGTLTLTAMDPSRRYRIVLLGNRGDPSYTSRDTVVTLSGADSFTNASSAGAEISGASSETSTIITGTNTGGLVFSYTGIAPGTDGQIALSVSGGAGNSFSWYLNTMLVELLPTNSAAYMDADTDGMDDSWETTYFGSTSSTNGGMLQDTDGDGSINYDEYRAGTDPTSASSAFVVSNAVLAAGSQVVLTWPSVAGHSYSIQQSTNLHAPWIVLQSSIAATAPINVYTASTAQARGCLRIRVD